MPTIHFLHGFVAFGKSEFAAALAQEIDAPIIRTDKLHAELNSGKPAIGLDKEARKKLFEIAKEKTEQLVKSGRDVIFDAGSWKRETRDSNRAWAASLGANCKYYSIKCSPEKALENLMARNKSNPGHFYSPERWKENFKLFEPMQDDEDFTEITAQKKPFFSYCHGRAD
ncbi:MAG: ATP-binding protein [Rickettsiales bacterium]|jgi:predicted kinase|nr:ATP-binding protein [Rickettsiales bacterium]